MTPRFFGELGERAASIANDLRDHLPSAKIPKSVELAADAADRVRERLLPSETARRLFEASSELEPGAWHERTTIVGKTEAGTQHPHRFVAMRLPDSLQLFFLNPEHEVGRQSVIRPKVVNAMAAHVFSNRPGEVAIVRYRADDPMRMADRRAVDRLESQWKSTKDLIERRGLPPELAGRERDVVYRVAVTGGGGILQSRYVTERDLRDYAERGERAGFLDSKERSQRAILDRFLSMMKEGAFRKIDEDRL
jgi:hypothetical protein